MKTWQEHLRRMSQQQLQDLCDAVDAELLRRQQRRFQRGFVYTTYLCDRIRGRRMAPRRVAA